MARPHELLRNAPRRRRKSGVRHPPGSGSNGQQLRQRGRLTVRNDGRPQRVRAGGELAILDPGPADHGRRLRMA